MAWQDGKVTAYRIAAKEARSVKVRVNGDVKTIQAERASQTMKSSVFTRIVALAAPQSLAIQAAVPRIARSARDVLSMRKE